jgi:hypothetical protein
MCSLCMIISILLHRHFPERGVLNLGGDRYRPDGDQWVTYHG